MHRVTSRKTTDAACPRSRGASGVARQSGNGLAQRAAGQGVPPDLYQLAAAARIDHADLSALLYVQGYARDEFVEK